MSVYIEISRKLIIEPCKKLYLDHIRSKHWNVTMVNWNINLIIMQEHTLTYFNIFWRYQCNLCLVVPWTKWQQRWTLSYLLYFTTYTYTIHLITLYLLITFDLYYRLHVHNTPLLFLILKNYNIFVPINIIFAINRQKSHNKQNGKPFENLYFLYFDLMKLLQSLNNDSLITIQHLDLIYIFTITYSV